MSPSFFSYLTLFVGSTLVLGSQPRKMALGLEVLWLDLPRLLTVQPSLLLRRTLYRCIAQASMLNGSSVSCATQSSRRYPVSGFYQMNPQWLAYAKRWGQDTSVRELPKPEASCALPISHESCCPSCQSFCLSQLFPRCCFPLWLSLHVSLRWGAFLGEGLQKKCGCRIRITGRDRQSQTCMDKDITTVLFCIYKSNAKEFSD